MNCVKEGDAWVLEFDPVEARWLSHSLGELAAHYRIDVGDLPEQLRDFWRGRLTTREKIEDLREESESLAEERLAWRSIRLPVVEHWLESYDEKKAGGEWTLKLSPSDLELFFTIINDRRLTLACAHAVTEQEMDCDFSEVKDKTLRQALMEIHLLAMFQEKCLRVLLGEDDYEN